MNNSSRGYRFLSANMRRANEDLRNLQTWISTVCDSTTLLYRKGEVDIATKTMYESVHQLEKRLQHMQLLLIKAQQEVKQIGSREEY